MIFLLLRVGSTSTPSQPGFYSPTAHWIGGIGSVPVTTGPGFRSLLAFWIGGISSVASAPVEELLVGGKQRYKGYPEPFTKPKEILVDSSNIDTLKYHKNSGSLEIKFQNGHVYEFGGVPEKKVKGVAKASSAGKYFHNNIKGMYSFSKRK